MTWHSGRGNDRIPNFVRYAAFYDLLYQDKDYAAEAEYVARTIRSAVPNARHILEFGSGTGRHGRLLADMGFDVHGIERSHEMRSIAQAANRRSSDSSGSFTCETGDICTVSLGRTFDAVISLFHVISYQTTDQTLQAAFRTAAEHLVPRGLFLLNVWHGPAVLCRAPSRHIKEVSNDLFRVKRTARSELHFDRSIVKVVYEFECEDRQSGKNFRFSEDHHMRYFFPTEMDLLAESCGLQRQRTEEFLTGAAPSPSTWDVMYTLQK